MAFGNSDGKVVIDTQLNNKGFVKGINGLGSQLGGLGSVVKKLGATIASAFAVRAIVNFSKECIELGSNIAEVQNVVDTAFGDMSYKVESFAETAIQNFGMSRLAAKKTASTYMAMAKGMGLADETASDMAISLAGMTGDIASFYNISQELADTKLKSVFTGETETLKDLGVVMTQANLKAYALKKGITKNYEAMTQAEQVALRYNYVMDSLSLAQGDFAKTSDSWANQTRILSMQWQEFMSIVGQTLITVLTPAVKVLNQVVSSLISVASAVNEVVSSMFGTQQAVTGSISESVAEQDAMTEATKETAKAQKGLLAGFDEINKMGSNSESDGGSMDMGSFALPSAAQTPEAATPAASPILTFFEELMTTMQPTIDAFGRLWERLQPIAAWTGGALVDFYNNFLVPLGVWALNDAVPLILDRISAALDALSVVWAKVQPGLQWLWENFLVPIGNYVVTEVVPAFFDGLNGLFETFGNIWAKVQPGLDWLWTNFLQPVAEWTGGVILDVLSKIADACRAFGDWCRDNQTVIEDIAIVVGAFALAFGLVNTAIGIWNAIAAIATTVTTAFGAAVAFLTSPVGLVVLAIGALIAIVVLLVKHWDEVKEAAGKCWEWIKQTWEKVASWFDKNIISPISTGFKNFINGLIGGVESFVNFFIRGINNVIGALNALSVSIPDWVPGLGGKKFGFNISAIKEIKLPRLATGAVVPPNREFMAMLGDNKKETEVVSPLSTMKQAMLEALRESGGAGRGNTTIVFEGELAALARILRPYIEDEGRRVGVPLVTK